MKTSADRDTLAGPVGITINISQIIGPVSIQTNTTVNNDYLVHGRKLISHWPRAKFLPLFNRSVNQPPEVIIHC